MTRFRRAVLFGEFGGGGNNWFNLSPLFRAIAISGRCSLGLLRPVVPPTEEQFETVRRGLTSEFFHDPKNT